MEGYQRGGGAGRMRGKGTGNKKHNWQAQNRQGEVKNTIEMENTKNLYVQSMYMNYGGECWREVGAGRGR